MTPSHFEDQPFNCLAYSFSMFARSWTETMFKKALEHDNIHSKLKYLVHDIVGGKHPYLPKAIRSLHSLSPSSIRLQQ
jgi:hypothetical protein